jgi:hypothetical protein
MRPIEAIPALFNEIIMNVIIRKRSNVAMKNHPSIFSCATKSERAIIQLVPVPGRDVPNQPHDGRLVSQQDHCAARALLHKRPAPVPASFTTSTPTATALFLGSCHLKRVSLGDSGSPAMIPKQFLIALIYHLQNYNNYKRKVRKTHFSAATETRPSEVKGTTI